MCRSIPRLKMCVVNDGVVEVVERIVGVACDEPCDKGGGCTNDFPADGAKSIVAMTQIPMYLNGQRV